MRSRVLTKLSMLGALFTVFACHSMGHVPPPTEAGREVMEIRMTRTRSLDVVDVDGSRRTLELVRIVRGQPIGMRGDSLLLQLHSWRGGNPDANHADLGQAAISTSDTGVSFFENRFSVNRTLMVLAIVVGLVALAIGQASVAGGGF
jgi:hypothetical protein